MSKIGTVLTILKILIKICCILLAFATIGLLLSIFIFARYEQWSLIHKLNPIILSYIVAWLFWFLGWKIIVTMQKLHDGTINIKKYLDFGLASKEEVMEKLGNETGKAVLEERGIVFWKFAFLWAIVGSIITLILINFGIIEGLQKLLKLFFGVP